MLIPSQQLTKFYYLRIASVSKLICVCFTALSRAEQFSILRKKKHMLHLQRACFFVKAGKFFNFGDDSTSKNLPVNFTRYLTII